MTRDCSATRTRRWRARLAGLPDPGAPQPCLHCGVMVRSQRTAPLCSQCWKLTADGRTVNRLRMQRARRTT